MTNDRAEMTETQKPVATAAPPRAATPQTVATIRWEDSNLKSSYANVCNVSSTREEIVMVFGINNAWERGQGDMVVHLSDRVILSPFAAKRLAGLLGNVIREYESRFGPLNVDIRRPDAAAPEA